MLLLTGLVLVGVGVPTAWADRHVFDTDRWTEAVAPLIEEPVVQRDVAAALAAPIADQLNLGQTLEAVLVRATEEVVATDAFARVWTPTVRLSHQHALEGLRSKGTGVNLVGDGVTLDRAALLEALRPRLAEAGLPFADQLPAGQGTIVLADGPDVARATEVARIVDTVGSRAVVIGALVLLGAVVVANHRSRALVLAGLGIAAVAGLLWLGLGLGDEGTGLLSEVEERRSTAVLTWEALSAPLDEMVLATAVVGGAVALLGVVAGVVAGVLRGGVGYGRTTRRSA